MRFHLFCSGRKVVYFLNNGAGDNKTIVFLLRVVANYNALPIDAK
jgi:hypothetical protein